MFKLLNFILFQANWFLCAWSLANDTALWIGLSLSFSMLLHLGVCAPEKRKALAFFFGGSAILGFILDSLLIQSGLLVFDSSFGLVGFSPWLMVGLWLNFATTFDHSMSWIQKRYGVGAVFGFFGGPLAYYGGVQLQAISLGDPQWQALLAIGIEWLLAMLILLYLHERLLAMPHKTNLAKVTVSVCLGLLIPSGLFGNTHYVGKAYDLDTKELVYTDEYREYQDEAGNLFAEVTYRSPEGKILAKKNIAYGSNRATPSFEIIYPQTQMKHGAEVDGNQMLLFTQESAKEPKQQKQFVIPQNAVIDAGFHYYVLSAWDRMLQGEVIPLQFVVPKKLDFFSFQGSMIRQEKWKGKDTVVLVIEVANYFLRWLVEPITLRYDRNTQQLLSYEGVSNIPDPTGENYDVYMEMEHVNSSVERMP